jgi:DNA-binding MarR family transcriptional regulator
VTPRVDRTVSHVGSAFGRMGAGGWAERRLDPQDRRAHVLAVTENANPVVERVWEIVRDTSTEALKSVTSHELHLLTDLLERVHCEFVVAGGA